LLAGSDSPRTDPWLIRLAPMSPTAEFPIIQHICKPASKLLPSLSFELPPAVLASDAFQSDAGQAAPPSEDPSLPDFHETSGRLFLSSTSNATAAISQLSPHFFHRKRLPAESSVAYDVAGRLSALTQSSQFRFVLVYLALSHLIGAAIHTATKAAHHRYTTNTREKKLSGLADHTIYGPLPSWPDVIPGG
jgi:hypothetical protein